MKITLRPEWRLRPLSSFLGILDLKTGVTIALLFAVCILLFLRVYVLDDYFFSSLTKSQEYMASYHSSQEPVLPLHSSASTYTPR